MTKNLKNVENDAKNDATGEGVMFTKEVQKAIGKRINDIRSKLKLNQSDFGRPLGISHSTLSQIESGNTNPSIGIIYKLQIIYDANLDYLFNGSGNMFKSAAGGLFPERNTIDFIETYEDLTWVADNSPLFKTLITANAARLFNDEETSIKENIDRFRKKKFKG